MEYYIHRNGASHGPYTRDDIQSMINTFQINRETMIWTASFGDWKRLADTDFEVNHVPNFNGGFQDSANFSNIFFDFIRPYLNFIDSGDFFRKPFSWLYTAIAVIQLIIPFAVLVSAIKLDVFRAPGEIVFGFIILWLIIAIAGWLSFQLWWDRRTKITFSSDKNAEFVATPVVSHLIQTFGEWFGTYTAVVGFFFTLIMLIFARGEGAYILMNILPFDSFMGSGVWSLVISPISGFFIIVLSRFFSEQLKAFSAIANNTKSNKNQTVD